MSHSAERQPPPPIGARRGGAPPNRARRAGRRAAPGARAGPRGSARGWECPGAPAAAVACGSLSRWGRRRESGGRGRCSSRRCCWVSSRSFGASGAEGRGAQSRRPRPRGASAPLPHPAWPLPGHPRGGRCRSARARGRRGVGPASPPFRRLGGRGGPAHTHGPPPLQPPAACPRRVPARLEALPLRGPRRTRGRRAGRVFPRSSHKGVSLSPPRPAVLGRRWPPREKRRSGRVQNLGRKWLLERSGSALGGALGDSGADRGPVARVRRGAGASGPPGWGPLGSAGGCARSGLVLLRTAGPRGVWANVCLYPRGPGLGTWGRKGWRPAARRRFFRSGLQLGRASQRTDEGCLLGHKTFVPYHKSLSLGSDCPRAQSLPIVQPRKQVYGEEMAFPHAQRTRGWKAPDALLLGLSFSFSSSPTYFLLPCPRTAGDTHGRVLGVCGAGYRRRPLWVPVLLPPRPLEVPFLSGTVSHCVRLGAPSSSTSLFLCSFPDFPRSRTGSESIATAPF